MIITDAMVEKAIDAYHAHTDELRGMDPDDMRAALEAALPCEPVAWQIRTRLTKGNWTFWLGDARPDVDEHFYEVRPLYTYEVKHDQDRL